MFEGLFQPMHLLVIFGIALLVFGPKKLPELGKGIGEGIRALKDSMKDHPSVQAKKMFKLDLNHAGCRGFDCDRTAPRPAIIAARWKGGTPGRPV